MEIALFLALFLLLLSQTWQGQIRLGIPSAPLLFALLALLQIIPVPSSWLASYFPARNPGVELARLWPQGWPTLTLSIYPHDTTLMLFKFLAYVSAFVLAAYLFDSRKRKSILVRILILIGFSEAVYGMVQFLTGWQQIFWYTRRYFTQEATGTYINRNHYAGVLDLTLPFAIAMAFYSFQHVSEARPDASPSRRPASSASTPSMRRPLPKLVLSLMFIKAAGPRDGPSTQTWAHSDVLCLQCNPGHSTAAYCSSPVTAVQ